jgi:outer membrane protein assembly factor BamB
VRSLILFTIALPAIAANWPGWRGPTGTGMADDQELPLTWSTTENVHWRTALPESGNSSPIVWSDKVFVTQALSDSKRRTLMCFDRANGKLLWQSGPNYTEPEPTPHDNPFCSATPVTDGERVVASFGSAGLYCYDFTGKELWHRDLGKMEHEFGNAASPILADDLCIWNFGPGKSSRLVALNKHTGETKWEAQPPKVPITGGSSQPDAGGSWSTPIQITVDGREELIATFPGCVVSYEPTTGKQRWFTGGLGSAVYSSPAVGDGKIVATTTGPGVALTIAVKPGGNGEIPKTSQLWQKQQMQGPVGSGVIREGYLFSIRYHGIAACIEMKTGETVWEERLKGTGARRGSWSSMVLVDDKIYLPNQSGDVFVLRAAPKFEVLAINSVNEPTNASLAISDGEIFLRTDVALWCISTRNK